MLGLARVLTITSWTALRKPISVLRPAIPAATMIILIAVVYEVLTQNFHLNEEVLRHKTPNTPMIVVQSLIPDSLFY